MLFFVFDCLIIGCLKIDLFPLSLQVEEEEKSP